MQARLQGSINLILLIVSSFLVYFSFTTFNTLAKFQNLIILQNQSSENQASPSKIGAHEGLLSEFEQLHAKLPWDADLSSMLIIVVNNLANETVNKGQQQALLSKAQDYYQHALSLRPRDVQVLSGQLDLLIDQGAPAEYILPKLDEVISFVPKDQDLKAELAMLCFKLLALNPQQSVKAQIIKRLQRLFNYSMDYRGLIVVKRYAKLYGQEDVLNKTLSQVQLK